LKNRARRLAVSGDKLISRLWLWFAKAQTAVRRMESLALRPRILIVPEACRLAVTVHVPGTGDREPGVIVRSCAVDADVGLPAKIDRAGWS
jgi:hypothetical protein